MADEFGPTTPAAPDPVDRRLRQLARDTEPLVVLTGPAAARRRGERRTARRRIGAVGLAAALALGIGSWQLLPRLGADRAGTMPAATVSAPTPQADLPARLQAELLPPGALPSYSTRLWEAVPGTLAAAKYRETCPLGALDLHALAEASRVYRSKDGLVAYYRLYALPTPESADQVRTELDGLIKGKCGAVQGLGADGTLPFGKGSYAQGSGGSAAGAEGKVPTSTVFLQSSGSYVAVLDISGVLVLPGAKTWTPQSGPWPGPCISQSLARLSGNPAGAASSLPSSSNHC